MLNQSKRLQELRIKGLSSYMYQYSARVSILFSPPPHLQVLVANLSTFVYTENLKPPSHGSKLKKVGNLLFSHTAIF